MTHKTIYRKDYQPPAFMVESISLEFDLHEDHALVRNCMHLKRQHPGALELYGEDMELISIQLDKKNLDKSAYRIQDGNLLIESCPDHLVLDVVTRIHPENNTELSGLYRTHQLFCTQCEAEGFRRMTYFPDRPDVLTTFTTRITADKQKYPVLLSNGNLLDKGETNDGRHWVVWHDPFKKPSYLFALVAGDLACVQDTFITASGKTVDLRVYVEPGNEDKCQHALDSLKKAMRWDEEEYGREYDLDIFMIVAVSDFNMGAMENKGLNIFNSKYILARPDTATDQDYADIEGVVGHEYFHNWTGNRVTCRDWFQLSLKEGLTVFRDQEFSRDMNSRDVNRILDVKALCNAQFPEDRGAMAHPVRPESYQEINNFYTATVYNKGAEVIRMQQTLLGKQGFRRGMDLYFKRHDGQAVTIDDFVCAMEDANGVDFSQFKLWYSQAGTPEIRVESDYRDGELTLTLSQSCRPTPECQKKKPFHIPIKFALFNKKGERIPVNQDILELREQRQTFHFTNLQEKPLISLLRDFSAPVLLHHDISDEDLLDLLRFEHNGYAKWNAASTLAIEQVVKSYQSEAPQSLPKTLIDAMQHVLDDAKTDKALRAEILTPPSFEEVAVRLNGIHVEQLEKARDGYRKELGGGLYDSARAHYEALWQREDHMMHSEAYQRRRLRNSCLWLMMKGNEQEAITLCQTQFSHARTMTDQIASFALLVNCKDNERRSKAIDQFYRQWHQDELVMDKWFAIQASCELPGTLAHVQKLLSHPAFNFKNPNKLRSLIGTFCFANHRHFHAPDGSGYSFLTEMLLKLDQYNPQVAARLATPFTRWQRLDKSRQDLIQKELQRLSKASLSWDLREMVSKSLNAS